MFERNKNRQATPVVDQPVEAKPMAAAVAAAPATARSGAMIGPGIKIKGEISGDEDLFVQGRVEGTINLGSNEVIVGESGVVAADINARTVKIDGEVAGDVKGEENVVISRSGNVCGNIVAPRVTLEDGAIFRGSIDMDPGEPAAKAVPIGAKKMSGPGSTDEDKSGLELKSSSA
jgi:cytoskeletal protein CcmA (bactofilin family)